MANRVDYLDVSKEDFSYDGAPSNFNIFRDNLKEVSLKMREKMIESLPDAKLDTDTSDSEDIVPLDFRTALLKNCDG